MLKLLFYFYSQDGKRISKSQIGKARYVLVKNKGFNIDDIHPFPSGVSKKDFLVGLKEYYNEKFLLITNDTIFPLRPNWDYETFENNGNIIKKDISERSKFYSLYFKNKFITSDSFPKRLSPKSKKKFLDELSIFIEKEMRKSELFEKYPELYDEDILEGVELIEIASDVSTFSYYYESMYESRAILNYKNLPPEKRMFSGMVAREEFFNLLDAEEDTNKIITHTRKLIREHGSVIKNNTNFNNSRLWQAMIKLVPMNDDGTISNRKYQIISTPQLPSVEKLMDILDTQLKDSLYDAKENYSETFTNRVGVQFLELKLVGN